MPLLLSRGHYLGSSILGLLSVFRRRGALAAKSSYCSDINTSSDQGNTSVYQSNGLCTNFCIQDYAFAVLQHQNCWCTNYIPATTKSGCNADCPGYPFEKCGGDGLYGYIALGKVAPSGTLGSGTSSQPTPEVTLPNPPPSPQFTSTAVITESVTSLTWTPTPVTSVRTISGSGVTVTLTPTEPPLSQSSLPASQKQMNGGLSTGAAVAITASLVALVAILCSVIYLCLRKRKDQNSQDVNSIGDRRGSSVGLGGQIPSRTMSENSRYVLGTDGRRVVETWEFKDDISPQNGRLVPVDPRLDPFAPVYRVGDNKSRDSVHTLRDDLDYSRRVHGGHRGPILRATNPDLDD